MDKKIGQPKRSRIGQTTHQKWIEARRQAVKAWADSPSFPDGAGPLVFAAAGRAATSAASAFRLLEEIQYHVLTRHVSIGSDDVDDILRAACLALGHCLPSERTPEVLRAYSLSKRTPKANKAFKVFHAAAFDYVATGGGEPGKASRFRRKVDFRKYLLERIHETAAAGPEVNKLFVVCCALRAGDNLLPALRTKEGDRSSFATLYDRLAKFDISRLVKPLPDPGEAGGGEAAVIAFDLLLAAGVPYADVDNFIHGAERAMKSRKRKAEAPAGVGPPPPPPRRRPPRRS